MGCRDRLLGCSNVFSWHLDYLFGYSDFFLHGVSTFCWDIYSQSVSPKDSVPFVHGPDCLVISADILSDYPGILYGRLGCSYGGLKTLFGC